MNRTLIAVVMLILPLVIASCNSLHAAGQGTGRDATFSAAFTAPTNN